MRFDSSRHLRSGAVLAETALVLPVLILVLIALTVLGLGVYRFQQVASLAREGARYAAVHGTQYAAETGQPAATPASVYSNAIQPMAVGLDLAQLSYTVTWSQNNQPAYADPSSTPPGTPVANKVIVTVTYQWIPEAYFGGLSLSSRAEMPMAY